ncbi:MAG: RNA methyltransferase, partial [Desulfuromonadales bacterium]|nr:RNA methyltransferase [Desulfuromonadales bacterium]
MKGSFSIALLHYPVYDKHKKMVTTAVTNLDIHDIARAACTFGVSAYYIVTPTEEQQELVKRITQHWQSGWGATYNPERKRALDNVKIAGSLGDVKESLKKEYGKEPVVVVTGASNHDNAIPVSDLIDRINNEDAPFLLVFGTGWGLTESIFEEADIILEPIYGVGDYNHLSVRSAVSIYLDRIFGQN